MFELTPFVRHPVPFDPFKELDEMEKSMFGGASFRTDIKDAGDAYIVEAELPGFAKEDVNISIDNDVMTVSASREEKKEEKNEKHRYVRKERRTCSYARSFDVSEIETEKIEGSLENGILTLTLPKKAVQKPASRKVELK